MPNDLKMIYVMTTNKCIAVHQDVKHGKLYFPKWTTLTPINCMCLIIASGIINARNANLNLFINQSFPQINYKLQSFRIKLYRQNNRLITCYLNHKSRQDVHYALGICTDSTDFDMLIVYIDTSIFDKPFSSKSRC